LTLKLYRRQSMDAHFNLGDSELPVSITEILKVKYGVNLNGCIIYNRKDCGSMLVAFVVRDRERYALLITWVTTPEYPTPSAYSLLWVGTLKDGRWVTVPALSGGVKTG
jgi:hypothetical protein